MAEPFLGQMIILTCNFAPRGWAQCNGQLLPINQNQALFSLLGTYYGGNGTTNFALPNLQGRVPIHIGNGHFQGEASGEAAHTLLPAEIATHSHTVRVTDMRASLLDPTSAILAQASTSAYTSTAGVIAGETLTSLHGATIAATGGSQAHNNLQPYLVLNVCIALQGIFPSVS